MQNKESLRPLILPTYKDSGITVIAGPCSAETQQQVADTARGLSTAGVKVFRAGVWKPRTLPGGFEGRGSEALAWIKQAGVENGMMTAVEVANPEHVKHALEAGIDILWIGARTTTSPFAVQEIAETVATINPDTIVLVKNPVNPDIDLWIGALQRLLGLGIKNVGAVHRGFSTYDASPYRNNPIWNLALQLAVRMPGLTIITDPSHMGGERTLIKPLAQEAIDMGFRGLMIESHCEPNAALSDSRQQLTPQELSEVLDTLHIGTNYDTLPQLEVFRKQIDILDAELLQVLAKRMEAARNIGLHKKECGMSVLQSERFREVVESGIAKGTDLGLSPAFIHALMNAIHEESVRQQVDVLKSSR